MHIQHIQLAVASNLTTSEVGRVACIGGEGVSDTYIAFMPICGANTLMDARQLSAQERAQYEKKHTKSQANYLAGRVLAKNLLTEHLGTNWRLLSVLHDAHGAPEVWLEGKKISVGISISHSHNWVACALNFDGHRVGVDIEQMRPRNTMLEMAQCLAHKDELLWVNRYCSRVEDFYRYWTAKEALAKVHRLPLMSNELQQYAIRKFTEMQSQKPWMAIDGTLMHHFQIPNEPFMGAWAIKTQDNALNT
jgi:4'-phosphopantetheinyl transferase EntD